MGGCYKLLGGSGVLPARYYKRMDMEKCATAPSSTHTGTRAVIGRAVPSDNGLEAMVLIRHYYSQAKDLLDGKGGGGGGEMDLEKFWSVFSISSSPRLPGKVISI